MARLTKKRMNTYNITLTTTEERNKESFLAWFLENRNLATTVAVRRILKPIRSGETLLQSSHGSRVGGGRHPPLELTIGATLPRVVRKVHDANIKHFITIHPLVEVAAAYNIRCIGGWGTTKLQQRKARPEDLGCLNCFTKACTP